jgi:hypothetical protein
VGSRIHNVRRPTSSSSSPAFFLRGLVSRMMVVGTLRMGAPAV